MGVAHVGCQGQISWPLMGLLGVHCKKCGKKWTRTSVLALGFPSDMYYKKVQKPFIKIQKGNTPYPKWAENNEVVAGIVSRLPNWPRWARILTVVGLFLSLGYIFYRIFSR